MKVPIWDFLRFFTYMKTTPLFFIISIISFFSIGAYAQVNLMDVYADDIDIVVSEDGTGDFETVQEAINAVPNYSSERTVVFIKNGSYYEKVRISASKQNLVLIGEDVDSTIIYYDDYAQSDTEDDTSVEIDADNFLAMNLTFENSYDKHDSQALAVTTNGDKQVFLHCRFIGWQDTYHTRTKKRNYLKDCFIEGCVDYIFGPAIAVFDSCQLHNNRQQGGYITAASTPEGNKFGYVFRNNVISADAGVDNIELGRPWREYAKTVFMNTYMNDIFRPGGWNDWGKTEAVYSTVFYAEFNNSGPGYQPDERVDWSHILTKEQASEYTLGNIFSKETSTSVSDDWLPDVDNDPLFKKLKQHVIPFMDSSNYDAGVVKIEFEGGQSLDFDPDQYTYMIELDPSSTVVPELNVITENAKASVNIEYPEALPGVTKITVTAYDRATISEYFIYNSVNDAYNNAFLDSIFIKYIKVDNFDPNVFEYDVVLPKGSSKYFAVAPHKQVADAGYRISKPSQLPGDLVITVTSYSGEVVNLYTFHITVSTGLAHRKTENTYQVSYLNNKLVLKTNNPKAESVTLQIFDLKGNSIYNNYIPSINASGHTVPLDMGNGIYFYRIRSEHAKSTGKFIIKNN